MRDLELEFNNAFKIIEFTARHPGIISKDTLDEAKRVVLDYLNNCA